ncbi:MAG: ribonuclease Z [Candidatus Korarchaeum sp.]|nr:ribonuclease Z [Candidatus Korarchaeum sp.]MDW8036219.1 ribonuclease Z [Candidatus Korarchaeum sp.]
MRIKFLGTSSAVPTDDRGLPAILVKTAGDSILLDCGEGTQRQMIRGKESIMNVSKVVITHLHGDHFFGLLPLIQTLGILRRSSEINVIGPKSLESLLNSILERTGSKPQFRVVFSEIEVGKEMDLGKFKLEFFEVDHNGFETYGVKLKEKDKPGEFDPKKADELGVPIFMRGFLQRGFTVKLPDGRVVSPSDVMGPPRRGPVIVYSSDTRPTKSVIEASKGADLLIHEATYLDELKDRAVSTGHSTALEAGEVAEASSVKKLVLTHFSARYSDEDLPKFQEEASKTYRGEVLIARDFLTIDI